jgi:hypothetical protein
MSRAETIGGFHLFPDMDAPKQRSSIVLPALGLCAAVAVRTALDLIIRRGEVSSTPTRPVRRQASATPLRSREVGGQPEAVFVLPREQRVRERAFQIWLDEGKPSGRHQDHWRKAELEIPE